MKTVPAAHKVAWTRYPIEFGYFPCKNDIVSGAALSVQARTGWHLVVRVRSPSEAQAGLARGSHP